MNKKLPILIIIPHGGYKIPEELRDYGAIEEFHLFMNADTCANDLFNIKDTATAIINTLTSRLYIDVDRPISAIPPLTDNGIIKTETLQGKKIYKKNYFPDDLAMSNIIHRYYLPFHETIDKILKTNEIRLILECHTMMAVGPGSSFDAGMPRPVMAIENVFYSNNKIIKTCSEELIEDFSSIMKKIFADEKNTVSETIRINDKSSKGYILKKYGRSNIPMIKISISKSLFLNDRYFSFDYLRVDEIRIKNLKTKFKRGIIKFYNGNF